MNPFQYIVTQFRTLRESTNGQNTANCVEESEKRVNLPWRTLDEILYSQLKPRRVSGQQTYLLPEKYKK